MLPKFHKPNLEDFSRNSIKITSSSLENSQKKLPESIQNESKKLLGSAG